jgi:ribonuclease HI
LYREIGWLPLNIERKLRVSQYTLRANTVENATNEELNLEFDNANDANTNACRLKTPKLSSRMLSVANYTEDLCQEAGVSRRDIVPVPDYPSPPWTLDPLKINCSLGPVTKSSNPSLLSVLAKEKIHEEFESAFQIYTDGSKINDCVGCAFHIPSLNVTKQYRLNGKISIFSAEMYAIFMALSYAIDVYPSPRDIVVLSDSRSALQALENTGKNRRGLAIEIHLLVHQLVGMGSKVTFQWVPSHTTIKGNDIADVAAKEGANLPSVTNDIGLTVAEASARLRSAVTAEWKAMYESQAQDREWIEPTISRDGTFPDLPPALLHLFYSLRGKSFKTKYSNQACTCNEKLTYGHIFSCSQVWNELDSVRMFLIKNGMSNYSCHTLLKRHPIHGWKHTHVFLRHLSRSSIGLYL